MGPLGRVPRDVQFLSGDTSGTWPPVADQGRGMTFTVLSLAEVETSPPFRLYRVSGTTCAGREDPSRPSPTVPSRRPVAPIARAVVPAGSSVRPSSPIRAVAAKGLLDNRGPRGGGFMPRLGPRLGAEGAASVRPGAVAALAQPPSRKFPGNFRLLSGCTLLHNSSSARQGGSPRARRNRRGDAPL